MPYQASSLGTLKFSHYRTNEEIGSGEVVVVFCTRDEHLDREVGFKFLRPRTITDKRARKHLHSEGLAFSKLSRLNIDTVWDFDMQKGLAFPGDVMGYIPEPRSARK